MRILSFFNISFKLKDDCFIMLVWERIYLKNLGRSCQSGTGGCEAGMLGEDAGWWEKCDHVPFFSQAVSYEHFLTFYLCFLKSDLLLCTGFTLWAWKWKWLSCVRLWDPLDYSVHGILQARKLECIAFLFSRGSSQPRDWTQVFHFAGGFLTSWATREAQEYWSG